MGAAGGRRGTTSDVPPSTPPRPRRGAWQIVKWLIIRSFQLGLLLGLCAAGGVVYLLHSVEQSLPDVNTMRAAYHPAQITRILDRDGGALAELFIERRTIVPIKDIPAHVKLSFIAAEDASFFEHEGLNYLGMLRALVVNLRSGKHRQGASTITQQVVKNVLLNDPSRTYRRKIREVVLARKLEQELSKDQILELYLNHIYLGGGRYGVEEAARYYFGKGVKEVSIAEAALLGGLTAGPELFSPRHDMPKALMRRTFVLDQMERKNFLDAARVEAAKADPVRLAPPTEVQSTLAPEVVEIARRTLKEIAGEDSARGGYTIHTTIDSRLQALARKSVRDNLQSLDKRTRAQAPFKAPPKKGAPKGEEKPYEGTPRASEWHKTFVGVVTRADDEHNALEIKVGDIEGVLKLSDLERYNPKQLPPSAFAEEGARLRVSFLVPPAPVAADKPAPRVPLRLEVGAESALVALDPRTRDVLALVGSYEGVASGLDRATQSRRQPGSTFKAVVYSLGIHTRKINPATVFDLAQIAPVKGAHVEDATVIPTLRLREAIARSVNPVAQKVLVDVGPANVVDWARRLGVKSQLGADLSLALGAYEVTPLEMAGVYATFPAGGVYEQPRVISRIVGPDGKDLPLPERPRPEAVLEPAEAYVMTSLLSSVITMGTGARARELGRPLAGKTGTTNQAKDTWFLGFSPEIVCAVWTGYDEPRPLGGGKEAGATAALPAWISFMKGAHDKHPIVDFSRPPGILDVRIDPVSGLRPYEGQTDAMNEIFLVGTEPVTVAQPDAGVDGGEEDAGPDAAAAPPASAAPAASSAAPAASAP
jgi:penicillin-binding protein 1A